MGSIYSSILNYPGFCTLPIIGRIYKDKFGERCKVLDVTGNNVIFYQLNHPPASDGSRYVSTEFRLSSFVENYTIMDEHETINDILKHYD